MAVSITDIRIWRGIESLFERFMRNDYLAVWKAQPEQKRQRLVSQWLRHELDLWPKHEAITVKAFACALEADPDFFFDIEQQHIDFKRRIDSAHNARRKRSVKMAAWQAKQIIEKARQQSH